MRRALGPEWDRRLTATGCRPGVGPRMHMAAAYAYRISFSSNFRFLEADSGDELHIVSGSGKFVTGPNAGIALTLSDIELGKEGSKGGVAFWHCYLPFNPNRIAL